MKSNFCEPRDDRRQMRVKLMGFPKTTKGTHPMASMASNGTAMGLADDIQGRNVPKMGFFMRNDMLFL